MAKTSISIDDADLEWLRARAARVHDGNLSAAISEATQLLRQQEALGRLLDRLGAPVLADREREALLAEIDGAPAGRRTRRRRRAA